MRLLYINACPRGEGISRTRQLGNAFLEAFVQAYPQDEIIRHDVPGMGLLPIDGESLSCREALIDARVWQDAVFDAARDFVQADGIVIAAPYWDLMFPAMLKVYIEHIFIREMTFCYREDRPIGLCKAKRALLIQTAGSPVAGADFGTEYLRATLAMLGITRFHSIMAEGLDLAGAEVEGIIDAAKAKAAAHGLTFWHETDIQGGSDV